MSKYTFEMDYDQVDSIVIQSLSSMRDCLKCDLEKVKAADRGQIFDCDKDKDLKEIKKYIKSFDRVLRYYGVGL